jgi:hypothetical protein
MPLNPTIEDIKFFAETREQIKSNKQIPIITVIILLICNSDKLFDNVSYTAETIADDIDSKGKDMTDKEWKVLVKNYIAMIRYFQLKQIFERAINTIEAKQIDDYYKQLHQEQFMEVDPKLEEILKQLNAGYLYYELFNNLGWELFQPIP